MRQRVFIVETFCDHRKEPHMSLSVKVFTDKQGFDDYIRDLINANKPHNWVTAPIFRKGDKP